MELKANKFMQSATIALEDIQLKTALDLGARSADVARIASMNETTDADGVRQQRVGRAHHAVGSSTTCTYPSRATVALPAACAPAEPRPARPTACDAPASTSLRPRTVGEV